MSGIDYAFPAADATTVSRLSGAGAASSAQISALQTSVTNQQNANFIQGLNTADGMSNNALTYGVTLSRNLTINNIANDMINLNKSTEGGAKDTYARQGEINEWQAQNKLDTLFFLQITFLFFTILVFMLFLRQYGVITSSILWIFVVVLGLIVVGTLVNRVSYTSNSRDQRHWNRRFLGLSDSGLTAKITCANG